MPREIRRVERPKAQGKLALPEQWIHLTTDVEPSTLMSLHFDAGKVDVDSVKRVQVPWDSCQKQVRHAWQAGRQADGQAARRTGRRAAGGSSSAFQSEPPSAFLPSFARDAVSEERFSSLFFLPQTKIEHVIGCFSEGREGSCDLISWP